MDEENPQKRRKINNDEKVLGKDGEMSLDDDIPIPKFDIKFNQLNFDKIFPSRDVTNGQNLLVLGKPSQTSHVITKILFNKLCCYHSGTVIYGLHYGSSFAGIFPDKSIYSGVSLEFLDNMLYNLKENANRQPEDKLRYLFIFSHLNTHETETFFRSSFFIEMSVNSSRYNSLFIYATEIPDNILRMDKVEREKIIPMNEDYLKEVHLCLTHEENKDKREFIFMRYNKHISSKDLFDNVLNSLTMNKHWLFMTDDDNGWGPFIRPGIYWSN